MNFGLDEDTKRIIKELGNTFADIGNKLTNELKRLNKNLEERNKKKK